MLSLTFNAGPIVDSISGIDFASLTGSSGNDTIDASAFHVIGTSTVTIFGAGGDDSIAGSPGSDVIDGGTGFDTVFGTGASGVTTLSNSLLTSTSLGVDSLSG